MIFAAFAKVIKRTGSPCGSSFFWFFIIFYVSRKKSINASKLEHLNTAEFVRMDARRRSSPCCIMDCVSEWMHGAEAPRCGPLPRSPLPRHPGRNFPATMRRNPSRIAPPSYGRPRMIPPRPPSISAELALRLRQGFEIGRRTNLFAKIRSRLPQIFGLESGGNTMLNDNHFRNNDKNCACTHIYLLLMKSDGAYMHFGIFLALNDKDC